MSKKQWCFLQNGSCRTMKQRITAMVVSACLFICTIFGSAAHTTVIGTHRNATGTRSIEEMWGNGQIDEVSLTTEVNRPVTQGMREKSEQYAKTRQLPFVDVAENDWFYSDVAAQFESGCMTGTSALMFSPESQLTRAQAATVLHRMAHSPEPTQKSSFLDTEENAWYAKAVAWGEETGVLRGVSPDTFLPNAMVTREQLVTILYRYAESQRVQVTLRTTLDGYTDGYMVGGYAKDAVEWAAAVGLIFGYGDGRILPLAGATRAECAAICNRLSSVIEMWKIRFTVQFDSAGGTAISKQIVDAGMNAVCPAEPVWSGYYFCGWTEETGSGTEREIFSFSDTAIEKNLTLYAIWKTIDEVAYGVRFAIVDDDGGHYTEPAERLGLAVGCTATAYDGETESGGVSDFDAIFPWSEIRQCNLVTDADGRTTVIKESIDTEKEIYIEIPCHYIRRYVENGYEYRWISPVPLAGFSVDPAFVENRKTLAHIYVAAYEMDENGDSRTGKIPKSELTREAFRSMAVRKGTGFGLLDLRTLLTLQNLYLVEYADKNVQNTIGGGIGYLQQPAPITKSLRTEKGSNRFVVTAENMDANAYWTTMQCDICQKASNQLVATRTVIAIRRYGEVGASPDLKRGEMEFVFSGEPIDITVDMIIGGAGQVTGLSNKVLYHTGKTSSFGGQDENCRYRCAVKYRGVENLWGNLWENLDGINIESGTTVFSVDMMQYSEDGEGYTPCPYPQETQPDNAGVETGQCFLKNLGYDPAMPWLALPVSSTHSVGTLTNKVLRENSFGDYYYWKSNADHFVFGGGFDHYWRCGMFTMRGWALEGQAWYLYGARSIFKPIE